MLHKERSWEHFCQDIGDVFVRWEPVGDEYTFFNPFVNEMVVNVDVFRMYMILGFLQ